MQVAKRWDQAQLFQILPMSLVGKIRNLRNFLTKEKKQYIILEGVLELAMRILLEYRTNPVPNMATDILLLNRRRLKDLGHFKEYAKKYLQESYRTCMHRQPTINIQFLASIPDSLGHLVLNELTLKGIAINSLLLIA